MKLYHGSNIEITEIDLTKSKPNKDFGRGFYLSADYKQALEMAEAKTRLSKGFPVVSTFEFNERILDSGFLKVKTFYKYSEEWARFILANRKNNGDNNIHDYDIVIGPIANDKVGVQIRRYLESEITLKTFIQKLKYMKGITIQYFFSTERAIKELHKI